MVKWLDLDHCARQAVLVADDTTDSPPDLSLARFDGVDLNQPFNVPQVDNVTVLPYLA